MAIAGVHETASALMLLGQMVTRWRIVVYCAIFVEHVQTLPDCFLSSSLWVKQYYLFTSLQVSG